MCTEYTVFKNDGCNMEVKQSNYLKVPSIDNNMLGTGLKDVLCIETEDSAKCYYLVEKATFSNEIFKFLIGVFKKKESELYEKVDRAKDIDIFYNLGYASIDFPAEFVVQECTDSKDYIEYGFFGKRLKRVFKGEFWNKDFSTSDPVLKVLRPIVLGIIEEWEGKGIAIDRIRFMSNISFTVDVGKISNHTMYKGVSRIFGNSSYATGDTNPLTDDTYEVIYTLVASDSDNVRNLCNLRASLATNIRQDVNNSLCLSNPTELVEKLLNTPLSVEITDNFISDKELYQRDLDRINGKKGKISHSKLKGTVDTLEKTKFGKYTPIQKAYNNLIKSSVGLQYNLIVDESLSKEGNYLAISVEFSSLDEVIKAFYNFLKLNGYGSTSIDVNRGNDLVFDFNNDSVDNFINSMKNAIGRDNLDIRVDDYCFSVLCFVSNNGLYTLMYERHLPSIDELQNDRKKALEIYNLLGEENSGFGKIDSLSNIELGKYPTVKSTYNTILKTLTGTKFNLSLDEYFDSKDGEVIMLVDTPSPNIVSVIQKLCNTFTNKSNSIIDVGFEKGNGSSNVLKIDYANSKQFNTIKDFIDSNNESEVKIENEINESNILIVLTKSDIGYSLRVSLSTPSI